MALVGRRETALAETAAGDPAALVVPADVTDAASVEAGFARIVAHWGRVDLVFNNAGMSLPPAPIDEIKVEDWLQLSATNITGMFLVARAAFGQMRRQHACWHP